MTGQTTQSPEYILALYSSANHCHGKLIIIFKEKFTFQFLEEYKNYKSFVDKHKISQMLLFSRLLIVLSLASVCTDFDSGFKDSSSEADFD